MISLISIILVNISTLMGGYGSYLLKKGASNFHITIEGIFKNKYVLWGIILYGLSTLTFVPALKYSDLLVVYPFVATSYIWALIFSIFLLKEKVTKSKIIGIIAIIIGVILVAIG
ncbi:MAG: EamA family transporter [Nitrospiraceae bacterium]|nr:EamA family transporter [Nitrospiraceae bacterium]